VRRKGKEGGQSRRALYEEMEGESNEPFDPIARQITPPFNVVYLLLGVYSVWVLNNPFPPKMPN
jgi:hypothetical protein